MSTIFTNGSAAGDVVGTPVAAAEPFFQTVKDSGGNQFQASVLKFATGTISTIGGETVFNAAAGVGLEIDVIGSGLTLSGSSPTATLANDLLTGKAGGQTITGDTASAGNLDLRSTSHATKGLTRIGGTTGLVYDETNKRLGLGVATPASTFQIGATDLGVPVLGAGNVGLISLQSSAGYCGIVAGSSAANQLFVVQHASGDGVIAGTGKFLLEAGGAVIAVLDAAAGLVGGQGAAATLLLGSTNSATKGKIAMGVAQTTVFDEANGRFGLGTGSPAVQFHSTGAVRMANFGAGAATFDASGNITSASDERLKNVQGAFARGLEAIKELRPILYRWNAESGMETEGVYAGFSAQNVQAAIPEGVGANSRGYLSLADRAVMAALVNAVKELDAKVEALRGN